MSRDRDWLEGLNATSDAELDRSADVVQVVGAAAAYQEHKTPTTYLRCQRMDICGQGFVPHDRAPAAFSLLTIALYASLDCSALYCCDYYY